MRSFDAVSMPYTAPSTAAVAMPRPNRTLTGITTTGAPHLGNYVGAIRPAIEASHAPDVEAFYFLADYHALVKCDDPGRIRQSCLEIAATWLALGLDVRRAYFYRQSDIPEIPALTWLLTCVTAKGVLNRAHAYKAAVDANTATGDDPDAGIGAGLYLYPVLMSADILMFNADRVPVGRDQVQHIEIARVIAQRFNHIYGAAWREATGNHGEPFVLPEAAIEEQVATLPGIDGRKMSKSYGNTIPLWLPPKELRRAVLAIVTDSRAPGEPKDPDPSNVFAIYRAFATADETAAMREAFAAGIGWGDAKQKLFERIDREIAPARERYDALIRKPDDIENALLDGAARARAISAPFLAALHATVGLGDAVQRRSRQTPGPAPKATGPAPRVKHFRDANGAFRFKLMAGDALLLESRAFASGREAGRYLAALIGGAVAFEPEPAADFAFVLPGPDGVVDAYGHADSMTVHAALATLRAERDGTA